eukprot:148963-Rhodomonas_salina.1
MLPALPVLVPTYPDVSSRIATGHGQSWLAKPKTPSRNRLFGTTCTRNMRFLVCDFAVDLYLTDLVHLRSELFA